MSGNGWSEKAENCEIPKDNFPYICPLHFIR